jgi:hypothetical protein
LTPISDEDLNAAERRKNRDKARPKGSLPHLPDRDAPLSELRDWLTRALNPPKGYRFEDFARHGRQLSNPAALVLITPPGGHVTFRFREQKGLARPGNLRPTIYSVTDGLCRPGHLSGPEASDVWCALCSVAHVMTQQDERDETADWLERFLEVCEPEEKYTLEPAGRYDALVAMKDRGAFGRRDANAMLANPDKSWGWRQPLLLVDSVTGRRWIRVAELATFVRTVMGSPMGYGVLDGRLLEIGAERLTYESRNGRVHPKVNLYLLPEVSAA